MVTLLCGLHPKLKICQLNQLNGYLYSCAQKIGAIHEFRLSFGHYIVRSIIDLTMTEVRTVTRQIQQLEIYLNNLVSALTRGELPVNLQPITQIFDNAIAYIQQIGRAHV